MNVPYPELRAAERAARKHFPNATKVLAQWTPTGETNVVVEVWTNKHARTLPYPFKFAVKA